MIKFIIGVILYSVGVYLALDYVADLHEPEKAKNMVYCGLGGIVIGLVLSIWGFIDGTTPKKA